MKNNKKLRRTIRRIAKKNEISFEDAATQLAEENKIEIPTTAADFIGEQVIYNGEKGILVQDEGGKITFETVCMPCKKSPF